MRSVRAARSIVHPGWLVVLMLACRPATGAQGVEQVPRDGATYWPAESWRRADPAEVGLDPARLDPLVARLQSNAVPGLHSLVIVRHGYVAVEAYFNGSSASQVHTMQSVSKSVTSLVAGIAISEGRMSVGSRLLDILPQYDSLVRGDERKRAVTIGHLLAMRSGINFHESPYAGSPLQALNNSTGDWVIHALAEPMNAAPGDRWQYNSGGVIALAAAVRAATGVPFDQYARDRLFAPIGISGETWFRSPYDGLPHTGGGLGLRATDLARIGYLVLRRGMWNGVAVVPAAWIDSSMVARTTRPRGFGPYPTDYGYLWWLMPDDSGGVMLVGSGNLNQWLFVIPRLDLVVVVTGGANQALVPDLLYRDILPAVIGD